MYCVNCGAMAATGASFCGQCGSAVSSTTGSPSSPPAQSGPPPTGMGFQPPRAGPPISETTVASHFATAPQMSKSYSAPVPEMSRHCGACGVSLDPRAVVCPRCGVPSQAPLGAKSKTTAVLLAVFLGPWTWLYTYARDAKKFWVGIGAALVWFVLLILAWTALAASVNTCTTQAALSNGCSVASTGAGFGIVVSVLAWIIFPGIWLWAVIDTAVKNDWYFSNFPNG